MLWVRVYLLRARSAASPRADGRRVRRRAARGVGDHRGRRGEPISAMTSRTKAVRISSADISGGDSGKK